MTRRITLAILGAVVLTLVLAGVGTLVLARFGARERTRNELVTQASELAGAIDEANATSAVNTLARLRRSLDLEGIAILRYGPAGRTVDALPAGVAAGDLDEIRLRNGDVLSGTHGSLVYAAAPAQVTLRPRAGGERILVVVVVTRQADTQLRPATGWFVLAAAIALAVGALLAWRLGRRLSRPVRDAGTAAERIAAGDLSTRLPAPAAAADDELAHLARALNAMAAELERSRGLERQFLLSVSHDLRTPLTSIRGYAEAIADGALPDPATGGAVILTEARRLERLVRDLLDLARLEANGFGFEPAPVDLTTVAEGTVDGFQLEAEAAGVSLVAQVPPQPVVVRGDADRLAQIGANLVENALKFARSRVVVSVSTAPGGARLDVIDDGPGIAGDDLPHVFERLYVSRHEPQRREAGSGLGLAIVRELVTAMGGTAEARPAPSGPGACLSVVLPLPPSP